MSSDSRGPTLTDPTGMGGVIAIDGFDYQLWDGIARLPAWLASPVFEALIFEGLEDLEARFFAPHATGMRFVDRFQAKSAQLAPSKVREVFEHFHDFEKHHPAVARVQTLVTPSLPPTLQWVGRDTDRVRKARPFYEPFPSVLAASDAKLEEDLVSEYGDDLGRFISNSVEVAERLLPDRATATTTFGLELARAFPSLDVGPKKVEAAFTALEGIARQSIRKPLERRQLLATIEGAIGAKLIADNVAVVNVRSDRNESSELAIEIDARRFSGGNTPFPEASVWDAEVKEPLRRTAGWLRAQNVSRVSLAGSYRLSTGFLIGWAFRSATGFEINIPTRSGAWFTDDHPPQGEFAPPSVDLPGPETSTTLIGRRLKVAVGVIRRPGDDLVAAGLDPNGVLAINFPQAITSGRQAQQMVAIVKESVSKAESRLRPDGIDLHLAGPAAFAVALGHRWNGIGPTQLYEWTSEKTYTPTVRI